MPSRDIPNFYSVDLFALSSHSLPDLNIYHVSPQPLTMSTLSWHTLVGPTHTIIVNPTSTKLQHHRTVIIQVPPAIREVLMAGAITVPEGVLEVVDEEEVEVVDEEEVEGGIDEGPIDVATPAVELFRNDTKQGLFVGVLLLLTGLGGLL